MKCLICRQAELIAGRTSVILERGEVKLAVNGAPARICPKCGEAYVDEEVVAQLLQRAKQMIESGEHEEAWNYV